MSSYQGFYNGVPVGMNNGSGAGTELIPSKYDPSIPLDPYEVYATTRPKDWLEMPKPNDDEIYLLVHIPDGGSALLAFTTACYGTSKIEFGTVENGAFIPNDITLNQNSGVKYETELLASSYDDLTSDYMKQAMVKISGTDITSWTASTHSSLNKYRSYSSWNIVDIRCRLPKGTTVTLTDGNSSNVDKTLAKLRYFSWEGSNQLSNAVNMFRNCRSLIAVLNLDTSKVTTMANMFNSCYSLHAIPEFDMSQVLNATYMFYRAYSITTVPKFDTSHVENASYMFGSCTSLFCIPELDLSSVTDMSYMFENCYALSHVPDLNTQSTVNMERAFKYACSMTAAPKLNFSNATNLKEMFNYCTSLKFVPTMNITKATNMDSMFSDVYSIGAITFDPNVTDWDGCYVSLAYQALGHNALVKLFESLPTISTQNTLALTANYDNSSLTESEKKIAIDKGWTLTL